MARHLEQIAGAGQQPRSDHDAGTHGIFRRPGDFAVLDDRGLGGRAPHVEGDEFRQSHLPGQGLGTDDPGGGARLDDVHGHFACGGGGGQPAVRLHQVQRCRDAAAVEVGAQVRAVLAHDGQDVGIDHRRRGALVFLDLGQDIARNADQETGGLFPCDLLDSHLVGGVDVGVEKAHRQHLDVFGQQPIEGPFHVGLVKGHLDVPLLVEAFGHLHPQIAVDQGRRFLPRQIVEPGHAQPPEFQDIAEPAGGDQSGFGALVFEDSVGDHGGGVQHLLHLRGPDAVLGENLLESFDDGARVVLDAGRHLLGEERSLVVQENDIGECPTDVGPNPKAGLATSSPVSIVHFLRPW